jgi:hypothetical protein
VAAPIARTRAAPSEIDDGTIAVQLRRPLGLSEPEIDALVAFLEALPPPTDGE